MHTNRHKHINNRARLNKMTTGWIAVNGRCMKSFKQSHNAATCGFCNFARGKNSRTLYENSRTFFENAQTFTIFPEKFRNTKNFRTLQGTLEWMTILRVLTINIGKMTVSGIWEKYMCHCLINVGNTSPMHLWPMECWETQVR